MDLRELRALELAARAKIIYDGSFWSVPSQTTSTIYRVQLTPEARCECENFSLRGDVCKHIMAARLVCEREFLGKGPATEATEVPRRPTYSQDWGAYTRAQIAEKAVDRGRPGNETQLWNETVERNDALAAAIISHDCFSRMAFFLKVF